MTKGNLIIYGKNDCMACLRCKQLAEIWGFNFQYKNIDDPGVFDEFLTHGTTPLVPVAIWNGNVYQGYEAFSQAIEDTMNDYGEGTV